MFKVSDRGSSVGPRAALLVVTVLIAVPGCIGLVGVPAAAADEASAAVTLTEAGSDAPQPPDRLVHELTPVPAPVPAPARAQEDAIPVRPPAAPATMLAPSPPGLVVSQPPQSPREVVVRSAQAISFQFEEFRKTVTVKLTLKSRIHGGECASNAAVKIQKLEVWKINGNTPSDPMIRKDLEVTTDRDGYFTVELGTFTVEKSRQHTIAPWMEYQNPCDPDAARFGNYIIASNAAKIDVGTKDLEMTFRLYTPADREP